LTNFIFTHTLSFKCLGSVRFSKEVNAKHDESDTKHENESEFLYKGFYF